MSATSCRCSAEPSSAASWSVAILRDSITELGDAFGQRRQTGDYPQDEIDSSRAIALISILTKDEVVGNVWDTQIWVTALGVLLGQSHVLGLCGVREWHLSAQWLTQGFNQSVFSLNCLQQELGVCSAVSGAKLTTVPKSSQEWYLGFC